MIRLKVQIINFESSIWNEIYIPWFSGDTGTVIGTELGGWLKVKFADSRLFKPLVRDIWWGYLKRLPGEKKTHRLRSDNEYLNNLVIPPHWCEVIRNPKHIDILLNHRGN